MTPEELVSYLLSKYSHISMSEFDRYDICYHDLKHFGLSQAKFKEALKVLTQKLFPGRVKIDISKQLNAL